MKKVLSIILASMVALSIAACGADEPVKTPNETPSGTQSETPSETPVGKVVEVQIGFENSMSEPIGKALEQWQKLVEEQGDGSLKIVLYPDSQLGSKNELIDSMLLGEPVMTLADGAFYADYGVKDFGILFGPFLSLWQWLNRYCIRLYRYCPVHQRTHKRGPWPNQIWPHHRTW